MSSDESPRDRARRFVEYGRQWHGLRVRVQDFEEADRVHPTRESERALKSAEHELRNFEESHPEEERHRYESEVASRSKRSE
jgi:hypothetical protein